MLQATDACGKGHTLCYSGLWTVYEPLTVHCQIHVVVLREQNYVQADLSQLHLAYTSAVSELYILHRTRKATPILKSRSGQRK